MHILVTILLGLVVGIIAKFLMPRRDRDPMGIIATILLGIGGALLAGWIGRALGWYGPDQSAGFITSIIGAMILLFIYHLFRRAVIKP